MPGESATDLIGRLFSYTPTVGREPLEDYCTECLAWLLKESVDFQREFLMWLKNLAPNPPLMFLWVEFTIKGDWRSLALPGLKDFQEEANKWRSPENHFYDFLQKATYFGFMQRVDEFLNGKPEEMLKWFETVTQEMEETKMPG